MNAFTVVLFIYLNLLDGLTTLWGLSRGGREVGLGISFLAHHGVPVLAALVVVKAASLFFGWLCAILGKDQVLQGCTLGLAGVVLWNIFVCIGA